MTPPIRAYRRPGSSVLVPLPDVPGAAELVGERLPYPDIIGHARRRTYRLDGIEGDRIPAGHWPTWLLLPFTGDPLLDRYYIAQLAREVIYDDFQARNRALQHGRKAKPARRKALHR